MDWNKLGAAVMVTAIIFAVIAVALLLLAGSIIYFGQVAGLAFLGMAIFTIFVICIYHDM